ncbi:FMN-binding protein [Oribacterium sp. WCC10]|uniref:FMN-binding protein n=1 Tax=Oribacterium sp. WCC10 TaxID=1855343 RepID=UPI0008E1D3B9|nr:FMN-binding protein [Oribacterium sp. WCC10]SFG14640.1 FMN-binding domain-containing protein [Oribacterium sp. WCC10]
MKRLILTSAVVLVAALTACGGNQVPSPETTAVTETVSEAVNTETGNAGEKSEKKEVSGSAEGFGGTITVSLVMEGDDIVEASIEGYDETPEIGGAALTELEKQLVEKDGFDIDGVSGATFTSEGVRNATKDALGLFLTDMKESNSETTEAKQ